MTLILDTLQVIARVHGHFIEGKAIDVVMSEKLLEVEMEILGQKRNVYIPYVSRLCALPSFLLVTF